MVSKAMVDLRGMALTQDLKSDPIAGNDVTFAIKHLKTERGRGLDHWAPREAGDLPEEAHHDFAELLNQCESACSMPLQMLLNLIKLLLKTNGEDRPIGLTAMLYCVGPSFEQPLPENGATRGLDIGMMP